MHKMVATGHGEDGGGTLAGGMVIPGKGNMFIANSFQRRFCFHFMSAIRNVLRRGVTEATLSLQVRRPPATRMASCAFPLVQVHKLLLHSKCGASENDFGPKP